jgi:hypothetical protein
MSDTQGTALAAGARAGGLLLAAFREGRTEEIQWTEVTVDGLVVTVASDAMKATLNDKPGVRLPVSYAEAVTICAELECISPTQKICDAMFEQAKAQLTAVPLVLTAADAAHITMVDFVLRFNDKVEAQIKSLSYSPGDLVFGAWKLWLLHPRLAERGAVNYGFWDKSHKPPKVIQTPGGQHDPQHYDYSQVLVPVRRIGRKEDTGEEVDLLDYIGTHDKVPAKFLDPYRPKR